MSDELLIKFLLKEASPEEDRYVNRWLGENQANRKKFEQFKTIWDTSKQLSQQNPINEDLAWQRFEVLREQSGLRSIHDGRTKRLNLNWLKVAAMVVISVGVLSAIYLLAIAPRSTYFGAIEVVAEETPLTDTLPDGTIITLNKHAKIAYNEELFSNKRKVKMSGEVFFDVRKDPARPFEVTADDIKVKVLGTSFNIKSNKDKTEVILETGSIQVSRNDVVIKLEPDEKAIARKEETGIIQEKQSDHLYDYYRSKVFKLDNTPLWRFVEVLNEVYPNRIVIEDSGIASLPLNTTFENESLTNILHTVCNMLQVRTEKHGKTITIKR